MIFSAKEKINMSTKLIKMQASTLLSGFSLSLKLQTYTAKLIINDIYYIFSKRIHIIYSILKEQGKIKSNAYAH